MRILIVAFTYLLGKGLFAQVPSSWQLTDENGLPSMLVYDVAQDQDGFFWLATEAGLFKYDGVKFENYSSETSKATAVGNLIIDSLNRVWCQNFSDQIFYVENGVTKEFVRHHKVDVKRFSSFKIDQNGLWISSNITKTLHNFNLNTNEHQAFEIGPLWSPFLMKGKFGIAIYYRDTVFGFNPATKRLEAKKPLQVSRNYIGKGFKHFNSYNGQLLFGDYNNDRFLIKQGRQIFEGVYPEDENFQLLCFFQEDDSTFWLGSSLGIFVYRSNAGSKKLKLIKNFNTSHYVTCIYKDYEKSIWTTTFRNGIHVIPNSKIESFNIESAVSVNPPISVISESKNGMLFCTSTGETFKGSYSKGFKQIKPKSKFEITSITQLKNQSYLLGNNQYRASDNVQTAYYHASTPKEVHFYKNRLFFASGVGSMRSNYTIGHLRIDSVKSEHFRNVRARASELDTLKSSWIVGYADGLFIHNLNNPHSFFEVKNKSESIFANSIKLLQNGDLWVGTIGQGLYIIRDNKVVAHYTTKNGLLSNNINDIEESNKGVWVATNRGLQKFIKEEKIFQNFTRFDGLSSNEITDIIIVKNRIWVATAKKLNTFPVEINPINSLEPNVFFTKATVGSNNEQIENGSQISFNHKTVNLSFTGLSFKSRGSFKYKYRTIGLDSSWQYKSGNNNNITHYALQPGDYEFQVFAINEDGMQSKSPATFSFSVEKPFYMSVIFYVFLIVSFIILTVLVSVSRIRFIRRKTEVEQLKGRVELEKAKLEQELRESQLASLKSQLNPHFIFNALNSIQEFILLNNTREANRFLGKFADLMRITLELSNSRMCSLQDELKVLKLYLELEGLRFEDSFEYKLTVGASINPQAVEIPSMLIQPYVENAIKHGLLHKKANRKLNVDFEIIDDQNELLVVIEDNGVGRDVAEAINAQRHKKHRSFATGANQKRLELLNIESGKTIVTEVFDLKNEYDNAIGTKVVLHIPINI
ncbi:MAG: histidine kinase [Bacteroidia bacterium]